MRSSVIRQLTEPDGEHVDQIQMSIFLVNKCILLKNSLDYYIKYLHILLFELL